MTFENRRLRVVGTGGTLREGSSSLGRLVVDMAENFSPERGSRTKKILVPLLMACGLLSKSTPPASSSFCAETVEVAV